MSRWGTTRRNSPSAPAIIPSTLDSSAPRAVLLLMSGCKHFKPPEIDSQHYYGYHFEILGFFQGRKEFKTIKLYGAVRSVTTTAKNQNQTHARHHNIGNYQIRYRFMTELQSFLAITSFNDLAVLTEDRLHVTPCIGGVCNYVKH